MTGFTDITKDQFLNSFMREKDIGNGKSQKENTSFSKILNDKLQQWDSFSLTKVFTDNILKKEGHRTLLSCPKDLFNLRERIVFDNSNQDFTKNNQIAKIIENTYLIRWDDDLDVKNTAKDVRFFAVFISPHLKGMILNGELEEIPSNIFFHPFGNDGQIAKNQSTYLVNGKIGDFYKNLSIRYLIENQVLLFQHLYAVKSNDHLNKSWHIPSCLVFPIFSGSAWENFPKFGKNGRYDFFLIIDNLVKYFSQQLFKKELKRGHTALSSFSRGATRIEVLLYSKYDKKNYNEIYLFDPYVENPINFSTQLKNWTKQNQNRKLRIYTALNSYNSVIENKSIIKNNITYFNEFNSVLKCHNDLIEEDKSILPKIDYLELKESVEAFNSSNTITLFYFPKHNFTVYQGKENFSGINLGWGHGWFVEKFLFHALYNSDF